MINRASSVHPRSKTSVRVFAKICQERAIDCGYAALACAMEGRAWERQQFINMMRRLGGLAEQAKNLNGLSQEAREK